MKRLILLLTCLVLLAFTTGDPKSEYYLPPLAYSVYSDDIDLDGDNDIVTGHNYYSGWSGVSILLNDSFGYFEFYDTIYLYGGQPDIQMANLNDNPIKEIIAKYVDPIIENEYIAVINDFDTNNISYFSLETYEGIGMLSHGDFNGDGYIDIIVASNPDFFWGVLYNDGTGNFSLPVYYDTEFPIMDISVGDINGDSIDDILFGGYHLEIHYGTPTGFDYQFLDFYRGHVELYDIDFDGDLDIATVFAFGQTTIFLYENTGNNNFILHQQQTLQGTSGIFGVADFNNDSLGDFLIFKQEKIILFYNKGDFQLNDPEIIPLSFIAGGDYLIKDLDNNQYPDLIFLIYGGNPALHILFNDGNGNFVEDPITNIEIPNSINKGQLNFIVFPNPVHSQATISFSIKKPAQVNLALFDITGKPVKQILQNTAFTAGKHSVPFKTDNKLQKGIYFIIMDIDNKYNQSIKIIIN